MEELLVNAIANIGVPTAIAFYVLIRVNNNITELTQAVRDLSYTLKESRK